MARIKIFSIVGVGALAATIALGACSSDSDKSDEKPPSTTAVAAETTDAGPTTTTPTFSGEGSAEACARWSDLSQRFGSINPTELAPGERQAAFEQVAAGLDELVAISPNEIANDVKVVDATIDKLLPLLAAVEYDLTQLGPEGDAILADQAFGAATFNINAYVAQVCVDIAPPTTGA